jgi:hypothetical protein
VVRLAPTSSLGFHGRLGSARRKRTNSFSSTGSIQHDVTFFRAGKKCLRVSIRLAHGSFLEHRFVGESKRLVCSLTLAKSRFLSSSIVHLVGFYSLCIGFVIFLRSLL